MGKKTKRYEDFKASKVPALWFTDGLDFRPSSTDYEYWDGHILLDIDRLNKNQSRSIFETLKNEHPEWMVLVKYSGSGSIHILCHTDVQQEHKTERHFNAAFDTFSIFLNGILRDYGLQEVPTDTMCRKIAQCMCLWNKESFFNDTHN